MGIARTGITWQHSTTIADDGVIPWAALADSRVLVTGGTGLIGSQIVRALLEANKTHGLSLQVLLPVRSTEKAQTLFGDAAAIRAFPWKLGELLPEDADFDFVIHGASTTASADFKNKPVEVILDAVDGCRTVLARARDCQAKRAVFLSSMEVYGDVNGIATEDNLGRLETMSARNSYPQAKRLCECLFASYFFEYGLSTSVARLAQTFGAGVSPDDKRVFAEFGRCALAGQDICLVTDGSKRNPYVSVDDAVRAILLILLEGKGGEAYNIANEDTYCSIREMAEMVLREFGTKETVVRHVPDSTREEQFRKSNVLKLDTHKMRSLGWYPIQGLSNMYAAMLHDWNQK